MMLTGLILLFFILGCASKKAKEEEQKVFNRETIPYCNLPNKVSIEPVNASAHPGLQLRQVQVVARHGSRVPHKLYNNCWSDYSVQWDCHLIDASAVGQEVPWIFRKVYDASPNVLGGTCHLGQLVTDGYLQERTNGDILGAAYIGEGPLKLFDTDALGSVKKEMIYLRSDDDPSARTEMSGESLLRGMFDATGEISLIWHTGDFELDNIYPNANVCPALSVIEHEAYASPEWGQYNSSEWVKELNLRMKKELPGYIWENMLDCLHTQACTERPFPGTFTKETFDDAVIFSSERLAFPFHWNDSYYSKLSMGPLMTDLLDNMKAVVDGEPALRFALFLGHDTTVLPLLCAWGVWDNIWPSYASMLALELYQQHGAEEEEEERGGDDGQGEWFFRLVYAGKELILPSCDEALCSFFTLEASVKSWAVKDPAGCEISSSKSIRTSKQGLAPPTAAGVTNMESPQQTGGAGGNERSSGSISSGTILAVAVLATSVGMFLGALLTIEWGRRGGLEDRPIAIGGEGEQEGPARRGAGGRFTYTVVNGR